MTTRATLILLRLLHPLVKAWDEFAERYRLRRVPALPAILLAVALGVLVPLQARMDPRPPGLTPGLAAERLGRYAQQHGADAAGPGFGPTGTILNPRPAYYWPAVHGAARYRFTLRRDDGTAWIDGTEVTTNYFLHAAGGGVEPGYGYEFTVEALGGDGKSLGTRRGTFAVAPEPTDLRELAENAQRLLRPFERELVLLGYYADKAQRASGTGAPGAPGVQPAASRHDVVAALLAARAASPTDFRDRMLALDRSDRFAAWLTTRIEALPQGTR